MLRNCARLMIAVAILAAQASGDSHTEADPPHSAAQEFLDYLKGGTVQANVRARWENARIDNVKVANALTLRTRLGYGSQPWHGLSAYAEFENIASPEGALYFDGVGANARGRTLVADPTGTELNQAYGDLSLAELPGLEETQSTLRGGRQRIVLDDARFIGNVGWRQNEQTYDAIKGSTSLGIEGLTALYTYAWEIHRIFGDRGAGRADTRDFGSDAHFINVRYDALAFIQATGFAYLLDFEDHPAGSAPANSSHTYGLRGTGAVPLADGLQLVYAGSYAYQREAGKNPVSDYDVHYGAVDVSLANGDYGSLGSGYEVLGSDNSVAQFRTPLATAHQFNGWADVFVDNGGAFGLRDAYAYIAPKLPFGFAGRMIFHQFWSDTGTERGTELDAMLTRQVFQYVELLAKFAWYKGQNINDSKAGISSGGRADRYRFWLQATFAF